jgi:ABC-type branched-subunit amino acid transport system permease subunit
VISYVFIIGAAMAALAGVLITMNYGTFDFYAGFIIGIKAFTAAVLGGSVRCLAPCSAGSFWDFRVAVLRSGQLGLQRRVQLLAAGSRSGLPASRPAGPSSCVEGVSDVFNH